MNGGGIVEAYDALGLARARELFVEYTDWLNVDLDFQDFQQELATLPGGYARPDGRLFLALVDGQAAGCIALRRFDAVTGEVNACGSGRRFAERASRELCLRASWKKRASSRTGAWCSTPWTT